ncbi:MAG: hypothetical protein MZV63_05970 [Marinilabiliales bacterium]|nr:hypothetical protein [Marinilabiliales bacterium]
MYGNLDKLVPDVINDPIRSSGRFAKKSVSKRSRQFESWGDAGGEERKPQMVEFRNPVKLEGRFISAMHFFSVIQRPLLK